ncbi:hypothetical protein [Rhizorhapis suberifaciens]|uniref:Uncharacterized protein n=1 Tax=Rhizorhapis suberifaciens TaxID=13656 RepID=A0A840HYT4_9SPHN|nr:hypothetical protein [Rhizorhapis suberifaciens]MBB4642576.1 hypothetical protein [Rhizorhapis suberifaciens]
MQQLISFAGLSVLIFIALKLLYWINAQIFLSFVHRFIGKEFWKFTLLEVGSAAIMSLSFSYSLVYKADGTIFPLVFIASGLAYLLYMAIRVWALSERRK